MRVYVCMSLLEYVLAGKRKSKLPSWVVLAYCSEIFAIWWVPLRGIIVYIEPAELLLFLSEM